MNRKIDALVAERVMGVSESKIYYQTYPDGKPVWHVTALLDEYSTDIAAAFDVVNHISGDYIKSKNLNLDCRYGDMVTVSIDQHAPYDVDVEIIATWNENNKLLAMASENTAPLAICIAALLAVGVPQTEIDETS
jgi:hypothetical protein